MNDSHAPKDPSGPNDSRRDFLKRLAAAGGLAGLGHFALVGGARKASADVLPDCSQTNPDNDCLLGEDDACEVFNPDSCPGSGNIVDYCGMTSPDGCTSGKPEDDICNQYSPDECSASLSGSDSCDFGFPN